MCDVSGLVAAAVSGEGCAAGVPTNDPKDSAEDTEAAAFRVPKAEALFDDVGPATPTAPMVFAGEAGDWLTLLVRDAVVDDGCVGCNEFDRDAADAAVAGGGATGDAKLTVWLAALVAAAPGAAGDVY